MHAGGHLPATWVTCKRNRHSLCSGCAGPAPLAHAGHDKSRFRVTEAESYLRKGERGRLTGWGASWLLAAERRLVRLSSGWSAKDTPYEAHCMCHLLVRDSLGQPSACPNLSWKLRVAGTADDCLGLGLKAQALFSCTAGAQGTATGLQAAASLLTYEPMVEFLPVYGYWEIRRQHCGEAAGPGSERGWRVRWEAFADQTSG